eukprot:680063_1
MARNGKDLLCEYVRNAQSINDIIPLLRAIPFQSIQDSICGHDMKCINKAFNNCYNKNKALELNQRQQIVDAQAFIPIVTYEQHNKTWVVHPKRTSLSDEEIANGYEGPLSSWKAVNYAVRPGDKLLFYDGHYIEIDGGEFTILNSHLQLIGIGNNVSIKTQQGATGCGSCLYFKNMKIEMVYPFNIQDHASISMEDCEIHLGSSYIYVGDSATFNVKRCTFSGQFAC